MNNLFDFDFSLPTPKMNYSYGYSAPPPVKINGGGVFATCYTCNTDLRQFQEEHVIRRLYEYTCQNKEITEHHSYTLSFCWRCAHQFLDKK